MFSHFLKHFENLIICAQSKVSNTCSLVSTLFKTNRNQYFMSFEIQAILIITVGIYKCTLCIFMTKPHVQRLFIFITFHADT